MVPNLCSAFAKNIAQSPSGNESMRFSITDPSLQMDLLFFFFCFSFSFLYSHYPSFFFRFAVFYLPSAHDSTDISGVFDDESIVAHAYNLATLKYWGQDTIIIFLEEINQRNGRTIKRRIY